MNERAIEDSLRAMLRAAAPPEVPAHLVDRARAIPSTVVVRPRWRPFSWPGRYRAAIPAALATLIVVASVVLIAPHAAPPSGSTLTSPIPSPVAASASPSESAVPVTVCGDLPRSYKGVFIPFLTCDAAISAALRSLPPEHPFIMGMEFGFGDYCRSTAPCPTSIQLLDGYVVLTFVTGPRLLISLRDESERSGVSVTSIEALP